ncbi:THUMP domain-containing protein 3 [Protopterus annectens]|uniref:THUMP domain-containing protein 3 n=1 Tax=Protopterus annectens TaxID=7888 RepID=UPI001CFBD89D|nr:THUMP domain-containing protein 3 [Protopterus annectens]XP_043934576.1 THUMP domain-containing protein 3 [Protopterus annectens]XP_043934577.1 THUMP domain-containing protein 3 [Protopterus annectens]
MQESSDPVMNSQNANTDGKPAPEGADCCLNQEENLVTIGATVPTGFEYTASDEVKEKLGVKCRVSKDRGRIYFDIPVDVLPQVHQLRSLDNLFVVVQEFLHYHFEETKEATLQGFMQLASQLPWEGALQVWRMNNTLKKRSRHKKSRQQCSANEEKPNDAENLHIDSLSLADSSDRMCNLDIPETPNILSSDIPPKCDFSCTEHLAAKEAAPLSERKGEEHDSVADSDSASLLKFRVTCSRAGEKHNFTSNDAARDFGGAIQDLFHWKADMTKFDIEVLLNIHQNEVVVGIALTEESLHRRNITHFGPTTLRSTLAYGMLRLCNPQPADIIIDPMCGTGAIPIEGAMEWPNSFHLAGDNNGMAVNRAANNFFSIQKKRQDKGRISCGIAADVAQWDICNIPLKTGSVDAIVTDMPFGKRMGSRKTNWDLYPTCLKEMGRICRPGSGRAVLLTQDKKCFIKAISKLRYLWCKSHTCWVNVGGLHAAVYLLKRTNTSFEKSEHVDNSEPAADVCNDE